MRFRNDTFARGFASWGSLQGTIRHFSVKGGTLLNVTNGYENVIYLQSHQGPTSENHFSLGPTKTYILNKYNTRIGPRYVYAIDDDTYFKDCIQVEDDFLVDCFDMTDIDYIEENGCSLR